MLAGLVRQRRLDPVALFTLVTLLFSLSLAAMTEDPRLLQLRESYLSAGLGGLMLLSAAIGRPMLLALAPRLLPADRRHLADHPLVRKLLTRLTWIWGFLYAGELAIKWWMVEQLTVGQVLALGPVVFAALTGLGCLLTLVAARTGRPAQQNLPPIPPPTYLPPGQRREPEDGRSLLGDSLARTAPADIER